jgi:hypothetical protein
MSHCAYCTSWYNCFTCDVDYIFWSNICVSENCNNLNCAACSPDYLRCVSCQPGFALSNGQCQKTASSSSSEAQQNYALMIILIVIGATLFVIAVATCLICLALRKRAQRREGE